MFRTVLALVLIAMAAPAWAGQSAEQLADAVVKDRDRIEHLTKAECRKILPVLGKWIDETIEANGNAGNFFGHPYNVCADKLRE